jgi:hypothetical protein
LRFVARWHIAEAHVQGGNAGEQGDIWFIDKPAKNDLHPTMKPIELVERAIRNSSKSRDSVLDLFGGSGTTMIAAERAARQRTPAVLVKPPTARAELCRGNSRPQSGGGGASAQTCLGRYNTPSAQHCAPGAREHR